MRWTSSWPLACALLAAGAPLAAWAQDTQAPETTQAQAAAGAAELAQRLITPGAAEVVRYIDELANNDEALNALVTRQFGSDLSPEKRQFAVAQQRRVFAAPGLKRFAWQVMREQWTKGATVQEMREAMGAASVSRTGKGLARLPVAQRRAFTRYLQQMYQGLPGEQCNQLMHPDTPVSVLLSVERSWMASLPLPRFETALGLYTEANLIQLNGPELPPPSAREQRLDEQANARFEARLQRQADRQFSAAAQARIERAEGQGREGCEFGELMMKTLQDMPDADFKRVSALLFSDL